MDKNISGLYAITDKQLLGKDSFKDAIQAVLAGGARIVQYRDKSSDSDRRFAEARIIVEACADAGALSIINDDVELAQSVGANGVHLGRLDQSLSSAREVLGANAIIGVSCYNRLELARDASKSGADYLAVGSMYSSGTKPEAISASIENLRTISELAKVPVVAIGGITVERVSELYSAGASAVAVVQSIFNISPSAIPSDIKAEKFILESIREKALAFSQEWSRCEQI